jgi:hypothetical protein
MCSSPYLDPTSPQPQEANISNESGVDAVVCQDLAMRTNRGVVLTAVTLATALPAAVALASSVPRPLAGHYKIEKAFSEVTSGSLVVTASRTKVRSVAFTPETPYCSSTAPIHISGSFHLYDVAANKHGASDNTPDWAITKKPGVPRNVTAHQAGEIVHGKLALSFGSKNGTRKPVRYVEGEFTATGCSALLGGTHG